MNAPAATVLKFNNPVPARRRMAAAPERDADQALLTAVMNGHPDALAGLYDRYGPRALGLAFRILKDRDQAEQVIQDAFLKVWRHAGRFEPTRGSFGTWLFTIVRNLSIDQLRRRRDETSLDDDQQSPAVEAQWRGPDISEAVYRRLESEQVRAALKKLPEAQRLVLELAYFEGLTRREIAERLDEPLGTIHTRARLGLEKLSGLLEV